MILNKKNIILLASLLAMFAFCCSFASAQPVTSTVSDEFIEDSGVELNNDKFTYSPRGRRDPFKPLMNDVQQIVGKTSGRLAKQKGPLEKFELNQFRLIALMVINGDPRAMVKGPDGKGYTVKVGEYIGLNDGKVKNIETKVLDVDVNGMRIEKSPDRIVVEEVGVDSLTGKEVRENRYIVM